MITSPEEFRQRLLEIQNSVDVVYTTLPSDESRFIIDANSRTITIPIEFQFLGVKNDHNAETIYFEIDRYFDDEDLSQHTCVIQISDKNNSNDGGIYPVTTMDTTSVDGKIIFGWEIKNDATSIVGDIYFSVRFYSIDNTDYTFTYNFNTLTAKSSILDTLDIDDTILVETYPSEFQVLTDKINDIDSSIPEWAKENNPDKSLKLEGQAADAKAVGDELAKKADKKTVEVQLDKKANTEDVKLELQKKADKDNAVFTSSISLGRKNNTTIGTNSTAIGTGVEASGQNSHAVGYYTKAPSSNQHVQGKYNIEDTENKYAHIVGNGTSDNNRSNAHTLDWDGNAWYHGKLSQDGNPTVDKDLVTLKYLKEYVQNAVTPANCSNLIGVYDKYLCKNKMEFKEPDDIVVNGAVICAVSCVKIVKNSDHIPATPDDGIIIDIIYKEDFNKHIYSFYIDQTTNPVEGETWYYKIFPFSSKGVYNSDDVNAVVIEAKPYTVYGFTIDPNTESDPFSKITYIEDNKNFIPAHMDYNTGEFDYGDWANAWFIADLKPCRLNSDGSVAYDLDPNDYSLKADGTASDITDSNVDGNIMVGIPRVYYKMTQNDDGTISYRFSDAKVDEEYKCYAHMDANGNEIPYSYQPAYNGSLINNKLRSLSGQSIMHSKNATTEIAYATANNLEGSNIWYTEVLADRMLINLLLMLIGKSTDTQTTFGNGHYTGGSSKQSSVLVTGTMDGKGLFWGTNGTGSGVKVFGIENYWGNHWRRIGGYICDNGVQKIKLTYGTQDGSLSTGYNTTGNGYIAIEDSTPTGSNGGYINEMIFTKYGLVPKKSSGSATTYFCDGMWYNNSVCSYALVGGYWSYGFSVGAFAVLLCDSVSLAHWISGASLSCKPLAPN